MKNKNKKNLSLIMLGISIVIIDRITKLLLIKCIKLKIMGIFS